MTITQWLLLATTTLGGGTIGWLLAANRQLKAKNRKLQADLGRVNFFTRSAP